MKVLKNLVIIALIIGLGSGGLWLLRSRIAPPATAQAASSYTQVVAVRQGNLASTVSAVGELDAVQLETLAFTRMSGTARLLTLDVKTGETVKAGQVLATIDPTRYQQAVDQAKSDLKAAEDKLTELTTPASTLAIAKADLAVAKAEQALQQAKEDLAKLQTPDLDALRYAVQEAKDNLELAKLQRVLAEHDSQAKSERDLAYAVAWHERRINDLEILVSEGRANLEQIAALADQRQKLAETQASLARVQASRELSLRAADAAVAKAEEALADAEESLAKALAGGDALALAKAKVAVQEADVALATAQDSRTTLVQGPDAATIAAARADVDKKRLALAEAEADLAATKLVAPFDGTVLKVNTTAGSLIGATTQILTVANMKNLQVVANIDETNIRRIAVGQDVTITFDAFPGQTFRGKVLSIPLQGTLQGNVMVYEVPVSLSGAENLPLLVGMTANVRVQVAQATNALLVPAVAIRQVGREYQVLVPNPDDPQGQPKAVTVEVGISDGTNTQITKGLNLGDKVIVQYQASSTSQANRTTNIISQLLGGRGLDFRMGGR